MSDTARATPKRPRAPTAPRVILTMDLDCFYASVALRSRPHLVDRPVAVVQKHLCVTTNYVARRLAGGGIPKMTPVSKALKACPDLVMIDGSDLTPFRVANAEVVRIVRSWLTERVKSITGKLGVDSFQCPCQKLGLDEIFVDLSELIRCEIEIGGQPWRFEGHIFGATDDDDVRRALMIGSQIGAELRRKITEETKLTLCGGVSSSKLLAKLAVNMQKPNAQTTFLPGNAPQYIATIQPRLLLGFGHAVEAKINSWAIKNSLSECRVVQDVLTWFGDGKSGHRTLSEVLGSEGDAKNVLAICRGVDETLVDDAGDAPKSMSSIDSFRTCTTMDDVRHRLTHQTEDLVRRLREDRLQYPRRPKTLTVSYRFRGQGYHGVSRSIGMPLEASALGDSVNETHELRPVVNAIVRAAIGVLKEHAGVCESAKFDLTLLAVGASNFSDKPETIKPPDSAKITTFFKGKNCGHSLKLSKSSSTKGKSYLHSISKETSRNSRTKLETATYQAKCPICDCQLPKGVLHMNAHVEQCLRNSDSTEVSKKKVTKLRTRTVDSFFRKS